MPYFDVGNFKLYYEMKGEGKPVVFSHSLVCDLEMFDQQPKCFPTSFLR